ncbi:hypothetical protein J1614_000750 [Plenodomus biglobosus]|nr:hypothetical protein J1614_000750 [Plenodomus biglobosus]
MIVLGDKGQSTRAAGSRVRPQIDNKPGIPGGGKPQNRATTALTAARPAVSPEMCINGQPGTWPWSLCCLRPGNAGTGRGLLAMLAEYWLQISSSGKQNPFTLRPVLRSYCIGCLEAREQISNIGLHVLGQTAAGPRLPPVLFAPNSAHGQDASRSVVDLGCVAVNEGGGESSSACAARLKAALNPIGTSSQQPLSDLSHLDS